MNKQALLQKLNFNSFLFAIVIAFFPLSLFAQSYTPTGFVNDYTNTLNTEQKSVLETQLSNLKLQTQNEIAIVLVPNLEGDYIEHYAVKLFEKWGIGDKEKDRGLLLLIALEERELKIEVGYGLEEFITDSEASLIINNYIVPEFKKGNFYAGIQAGIDQIIGQILTNDSSIAVTNPESPYVGYIFYFIYGAVFILTIVKGWWLGGVLGFIIGLLLHSHFGTMPLKILFILFCVFMGLLLDFLLSKYRIMGGHIGGGGRGSSGSGFGGFGGGMSGGGGASGRW